MAAHEYSHRPRAQCKAVYIGNASVAGSVSATVLTARSPAPSRVELHAWGTYKKMNGDEQELGELVQLKYRSHGLKNQQLG